MTNCLNCGAPITGSHCQYCGSIFRKITLIDIPSLGSYPEMIDVTTLEDGHNVYIVEESGFEL